MSQPGKQTHESLTVQLPGRADAELRYLLFLPVGYHERHDPWPMMLFLHGAGECGDDLDRVKAHGPPKIVEKENDFDFVVLSPQCCPGRDASYGWEPEPLIQLVDHALKTYRVDSDRVYVTGISMGGYGTWRLAAAYPDRFAAIVPICGGGDVRDAERLKSMPIWTFHGEQDDIVPISETERMVRAIQAADGEPKFTVYPDVGHDSWTVTYETWDVYGWMLSQSLLAARLHHD